MKQDQVMLRWIIKKSLNFRYLILIIGMIMVVYGALVFREMPVDAFPEFAPPLVEIQTEGLGMSAIEVEELITIPMEQLLKATPGLDVIRSKSVEGLSAINLIFEPGTDVLLARQLVFERLDLTKHDLPAFANPVMLAPLSATSRVMKIGVTSKKYDLMDLSMIAYWKIRFRLMRVPGVANVAIWGERIKSLQVQVDPAKMKAKGISLDTVMETTSDALDFGLLPYLSSSKVQIDGFLETPNQRLTIQQKLPIIEPEDLAKLPLQTKQAGTDTAITLGDVSEVKWDFPLLIGDAVINDGPGLMLIIEKFPWANTLTVTHEVEAALNSLKPSLPDIEIHSNIFRPATFIEMSIANLTRALYLGCILIVLVLIVFLNNWRVALISSTAIPLSLLAAGIVFHLFETPINTMILAGLVIALGAIVDDAIVDIENIMRRLRLDRIDGSKIPTADIIVEASLEVRNAIIYSTLIEVLVLLPVFLMEGLSGAFFKPLAMSYSIAVVASTVVALTFTPALALILLKNAPVDEKESPIMRWLKSGYKVILSRIIYKPAAAYITIGVIALIGILILPQLGQELLPAFKERDFLMHWVTTPGTSHEEMYRITKEASKELRTIPGVRNFGAHIGRALIADEVVGMNFTENWISLEPDLPYEESVAKIQEVVDGYPGIYRDVQTYLKERIREVLTGAGEAIVVRIYGPELGVLREKANEVEKALSNVEGLIGLHVELQQQIPQIQVKVDLEKTHLYGLKPGDIRRASATMMSGSEVSDIFREGKVYDVMVWSLPSSRKSLKNVKELLIDTPDGGTVRLDEVADVRIAPTPNIIKRENDSRRIDIGANVQGRDLGSVVKDVEAQLSRVQFPLGYYVQLLGEYAERQVAQQKLLITSLISMIGILLLLNASFGSWKLTAISFLTLPAALVGGIIAVYFVGGIISLGSLVGFLTVLGIVSRNGIMMINHYQHLEKFEGVPFGPELVLRGALERLTPILITAIVTGLALVPLVVAGNIPGHEIEHPTAVVIIGGLVTSTLLNLFVIPPLYLRYGACPKEVVEESMS